MFENNAMQLSLTPIAISIFSLAQRTGIADRENIVTNTTASVMLARRLTLSVDVTTCAALAWSVCLEFVEKPCRAEPREQGARRTANVIPDCAALKFTGSRSADGCSKRVKIVVFRRVALIIL